MPTIEPHHDVTRAPSGESPASSESAAEEEPDTGKCAVSSHSPIDSPSPALSSGNNDLFDFPFSPSPNSAVHQLPVPDSSDPSLFFLSPHHHLTLPHPHRPLNKPQPLPRIASQLHSLLTRCALPPEYATVATQVLDLHFFKSRALASKSPNANVEHEAARRAQYIDAELTRLANRFAFNNLFAGMTGFAFDPSSFLSLAPSHPSTTSPYAPSYNSPMTVWSPELVPDSMSTFSGSSAPTSPAAPLLPMGSSSHHTPMGDLFYDSIPQHQHQMYDSYMPMHQPNSQSQQFGSALGFGSLGALGLTSSDFLFNDYSVPSSSSSHPAIGLSLPNSTSPVIAISPKIAPSQPPPFSASHSASTPVTPAVTTHDSDPLQIHHETCTLLLQAVLTTSASTAYDYVDPGHELEECLQRLTTKFTPLSHSLLSSSEYSLFGASSLPPTPSSEYLFAATVAGALSTSPDRRAFFRGIVAAIESRTGGNECVALLDEAWRE